MQLLRRLGQRLGLVSESNEIAGKLVFRLIEPSEVKDLWERRIIELGDGRSISEIIDILYKEAIKAGASAIDIGLWWDLFNQSVVKTISQLANSGYISLKPGDGSLSKEE